MIITTSAATVVFREEYWWNTFLPQGSASSTVAADFFPEPRETKGRRQKGLWYRPNSFWAIPPRDLGNVRSDRLDDFLYGNE